MSLIVWLPLNGSLKNQGINGMTFSLSGGSAITTDSAGKIGSCYKRTSQDTNRIRSSSTINLSGDISMCCWAYVTNTLAGDTANGLITNHDHSSSTGVGITVKQVSTSDYRISCNTGYGSGRTYCSYYGSTNIKDKWCHLTLTYSKSAQQLKLWVNGTCEYTLNSYNNSSKADYIDIFSWSTGYNDANYRPACKLNDVRIYDHCLTPQEVKEISKGLVAHYTLGSADVYEATTNIASSLTPVQSGGWGGMTITKKGNNWYHLRAASTAADSWHTFVYTLPDDCLNLTITFSAVISGITTSNVNLANSWIFIGQGNDGLYPTHGSSTFNYNLLKNHLLLSWSGTLTNSHKYLIIECWNSGVPSGSTGSIEFDLSGILIEKKNHRTQYVDGTRSTGLVYDSSGYSNNGTISGTINISNDTPRYDISTVFNGSNTIIKGTLLLFTDYKYTASFWVNPISIDSGTRWVFAIGNGSNHQFGCYITNNNIFTQVGGVVGSGTTTWSTSFSTNTWYHVAIVSDGTNVKVYKNGELLGTTAKNGTTTGSTFWIGERPGAEGSYDLNGKLSDFRIYATALSADDVTELYNLGASIS